ncbi:cardiolipin synthase ClsB [Variovorax sp. PCZ-1]|uniref:cardiolipin synthase ClsB n=1 Tax=Variovorax sp. PCZ-1 TaxID=2835533 RepID=UPI001BD144AD|nr:cardiolipin synthase ClsB [Variovorax sp. PCZ-1]MBS7806653.1 cardiolipin synthase ClsB [Variovorax sp. PCZ-1]
MPVFKDGHQLSLLSGSSAYFSALAQDCETARHEVRLETYIFDFTASGQDVANSLIRAALRGVKVHLLMDGAGTEYVPPEWQARFDAAGVQWRVYNPLGRLGLLIPSRWRRLHRKLCVIDGSTAQAVGFCGGINILDDFYDPNHGALPQPRFDFAVRVQGALVGDILDATRSLWLRQNAYLQLRERKLQAAMQTWASARETHTRISLAAGHSAENHAPSALSAHFARAALLLRDNVRHRQRIERAYLKAISQAQHEIIIANAYFLPGGKLRKALLGAAKRGVKVKLLLQGRYEYFMQYHAARPVYEVLLSAGIEIHEYATSFLHAKVAVIDAHSAKAWATVGSSNLDPLSLLLAREANIVVLDGAFARDLRERLINAMTQDGKQVSAHEFANRPLLQRMLDRIAFGLMRLALSITGRRY